MASVLLFLVLAVVLGAWFVWVVGIYALPVAVGLWAGGWAHGAQAGWLASTTVFLTVAFVSFAILKEAYRRLRYPPLRFALSALYCVPALVFAYNAVGDIAELSGEIGVWKEVVAAGGAALIGLAAFVRLAAPPPGVEEDGR